MSATKWRTGLSSVGVLALAFTMFMVGSYAFDDNHSAQAANQSAGYFAEEELGVQIITPTVSTALTLPSANVRHAEFLIEDGDVLVRWNGAVPADATAFKWPQGHMRKEANDRGKLINVRFLNAPGETAKIRVQYFGDKRQP